MAPKKKLIEQVKAIMWERGQTALEIAKQTVAQENIQSPLLREALDYFMNEIWEDVLHPALLSIACEAAGGNPNSTTQIGAAIVLLAGGADVHDDIIDQSETKDAKLTVFGKF
jgi:geranylgeranyl pyrophosphate synthase